MNDYNELIDKLRFYADAADDLIYGICVNSPKVMFQAADAIEQLIKERDVAVKEISIYHYCRSCKHSDVSEEKEPCISCNQCWAGREKCNWQWRGVQEDNDAAD